METNNREKGQGMAVPVAIVAAGAVVALTIFYAYGVNIGTRLSDELGVSKSAQIPGIAGKDEYEVKPVTEKDHITGDLNAPVKVVEYSDTECPYCKQFHYTMKSIMEAYGGNPRTEGAEQSSYDGNPRTEGSEQSSYGGKAVWVYRHFPVEQLHPVKARAEAEALECANELGGNKAFWAYLDKLFEVTPSNNQLDLALLPEIAKYVGLEKDKFKICLDGGQYANHVAQEAEEAISAGGTGTPYTIVIAPDGRKFPIVGAQSYEVISSLIDAALRGK